MDTRHSRFALLVTLAASAGALFFLALAAWPATAAAPFLSVLGASPGGFLLVTSTPTPTPAPVCPLAWRRTSSPNIGTNDNSLSGVAAISSNDVWAVGGYFDQAAFQSRPLIEHWDGTQWTAVTPPAVRATLSGVAAVSTDNVWAVGNSYPGSNHTFVMHWDGTQWSVVPSPNATTDDWLNSITVISANDIWAAGYSVVSPATVRTLSLHWNGSIWSVVPSPNASTGDNYFYGITAVAANDVWAVGDWRIGGGPFQTLTEHWDGSQWSVVPSPNFGGGYNVFFAASALTSNDVWAAGYAGGQTLIEHWDGSQWSRTPSPNIGTTFNDIHGLAAITANDVWAVGYYCSGSCEFDLPHHPIIEHWDGSAWNLVTSAAVPTYGNWLSAVSALSDTEVWAVGYFGASSSEPDRTLVERYSDDCPPPCCPLPTGTGTASCGGFRSYGYNFTITNTCELSITARTAVTFEVSYSPGGPWTTFLGSGYSTTVFQPGPNTVSNMMGVTPSGYSWFRAHLNSAEINECWVLDVYTPPVQTCNVTPTPTRTYTPTPTQSRTRTATLTTTATATPTCPPLRMVIGQGQPAHPALVHASHDATNSFAKARSTAPTKNSKLKTQNSRLTSPITFALDDGTRDTSIGYGADPYERAALWLNRFTPPASAYPITINGIQVLWPDQSATGDNLPGKTARLVVYQDADGDGNPSNATLLGQTNIVIGSVETYENYPVNIVAPGPTGDIYIGFEDSWAEPGWIPRMYPASQDTTASQARSWIAAMGSGAPPDVNNLGNNDTLATIDSFGYPGNWMVRATANTNAGGCPPTYTPTPSAAAWLVAHVLWQGPPAQPDPKQQLPVTLTLKAGATEVNYATQNTDASGYFAVSVTGMPNGTYSWRAKGPRYLANSGNVTLTGASTTNVEMGLLRAGDCDNNNVVNLGDFSILKPTFGKGLGDPGYDARADFTNDNVVNLTDFNLLKTNFGQGGAPPVSPGR